VLRCTEISQQIVAVGQSLHIHDVRAMSASPPITTKLLRHGNRNGRLAKDFEATPHTPSLSAAPITDRSCVMTFEPDSRLVAGGLLRTLTIRLLTMWIVFDPHTCGHNHEGKSRVGFELKNRWSSPP
jgi:hypothetical protein